MGRPQVDEFVLSMNQATWKAASFAKEIFWEALGEMTFEDAKKILSGHEMAAKDYFKSKTSPLYKWLSEFSKWLIDFSSDIMSRP